jgi:tRNA pseudouridine38-40 synthase
MKRIAVKIAYLGDEFAGSQIQPDLRTVEGEVLSNLTAIKNCDEPDMKCASRTDRGVNALGNVVVFNTDFNDNDVLLKALNAVSKGVCYRSAATVDKDFNPRHADERVYRYILPADGINVEKAKECASLFVGEHDFIRFCKADDKPTVMNMHSVTVNEGEEVLIIEFRSEYFLWNQIRRIASAISSVGRGEMSVDAVRDALNGRPISIGPARPDALTLIDVIYNDIEFITPAADLFSEKIKEELFVYSLRNEFFNSL